MSSPFELIPTPLTGLTLVQRQVHEDDRGRFSRLFSMEGLREHGFSENVSQINHSVSLRRGTVRGMHFQYPPASEAKLVTCIRGCIFDVAVDLRPDSPGYLHWHGIYLSPDNQRSLLIPKGFAHGFQTMEDHSELIYVHSAAYQPELEGGIHPQDETVAIQWPLPVTNLSLRDRSHPPIDESFSGIRL